MFTGYRLGPPLSNSKPRISVILHAARSGQNVLKCINSLLDQTLSREYYEIIVVDDASNDDTARVLQSFGDTLTVIRTEEKWGSSKSRNQGVKLAKGEIVLFTGVDCVADSRLLEEHLDSHSKYDCCGVVGRIDWQDDTSKSSFLEFIVESGMLFVQSWSGPCVGERFSGF